MAYYDVPDPFPNQWLLKPKGGQSWADIKPGQPGPEDWVPGQLTVFSDFSGDKYKKYLEVLKAKEAKTPQPKWEYVLRCVECHEYFVVVSTDKPDSFGGLAPQHNVPVDMFTPQAGPWFCPGQYRTAKMIGFRPKVAPKSNMELFWEEGQGDAAS